MRLRVLFYSLFFLLCVGSVEMHAQFHWTYRIDEKTLIGTGYGNHRIHHTVSDGNMGAWVVFTLDLTIEDGDQELIYVQHVDSLGKTPMGWFPGLRLGYEYDAMYYPDVISDGEGGIILAGIRHRFIPNVGWRGGVTIWNLQDQPAPGLWGATPWTYGIDYLFPVQIATDMRRGVWAIAYNDSTMYLKHVLDGGHVVEDSMGTVVCRTVYNPVRGDQPEIISDGAGGVYLAWMDFRKAFKAKLTGVRYNDLWMQHIDSSGVPLWGEQGIPIDTSEDWHSEPRLIGDGAGGVMVVYYNNIDSSLNVQRINADGTPAWNPRKVTAKHFMHRYPEYLLWEDIKIFIAPTDDHELLLATSESYPPPNNLHRTWYQRITTSGHLRWNNGQGLTMNSTLKLGGIAPDDSGGIFIVKTFALQDRSEIVLQRRSANGVSKIGGLGKTVYRMNGEHEFYFSDYHTHKRTNVINDGRGGVIGFWGETDRVEFNVYKQSIYGFRTNVNGDKYPVEFTAFTAAQIGPRVLLEWHTASETNNYGFTVERSLDGETWNDIGFVKGHGTTGLQQSYTYSDPITGYAQTLWYRLRQQDFDGTFSYGIEVAVELSGASAIPGGISVYPNPAREQATAVFTLERAGTVRLSLYNTTGVEVRSVTELRTEPGIQTIIVPTAGLAPGMYLCAVRNAGKVHTKRIAVVQ